MGWHRLKDYETTREVTGDDPFELCDHCISCLILLWENYWGRRPTENELNIAWQSALEANVKNESIPKKVEMKKTITHEDPLCQ